MKLTPQQLAEIDEYLNESPSKPFDADATTIVKLFRCSKALRRHITALEAEKAGLVKVETLAMSLCNVYFRSGVDTGPLMEKLYKLLSKQEQES